MMFRQKYYISAGILSFGLGGYMSLKKTWFSYVLWFVFTAVTALIAYSVLTEVLQEFYSLLGSYVPGYAFYVDLGAKILTVLAVVLVVVLLRFICSKIKTPALPKWLGIILHILIGVGIITAFCALRYPAYIHAYYLQAYSHAPSTQVQCFYELSKVGAVTGSGLTVGTLSVLEQAYTSVLRTLFLFFGNKVEFLLFTQLILQALSLILLMLIGWTLQKGIFAWIPALLYAVLPTFFYTAEDVGITNFWTFVVILGLFIICLLEKAWKKKNVTYLVLVIAQLLFAGFVFLTKMDVLLYSKVPFVSGGTTPGVTGILDVEMLVLAVLLVTYCVSFFFDKQDHRSLFVLPFVGFGFLFVWLSNYEYEASYCMMLLAILNLFFMVSQSVRVIFAAKPEVVTGQNRVVEVTKTPETPETADIPVEQENEIGPVGFEWAEMKEVMHSTEGIEVRKEELPKVELPITEVSVEEKKVAEIKNVEEQGKGIVIDRKAPIENVLPMPKKHKPKVLNYAFEPTEDMMHYDVEIENDEYDY